MGKNRNNRNKSKQRAAQGSDVQDSSQDQEINEKEKESASESHEEDQATPGSTNPGSSAKVEEDTRSKIEDTAAPKEQEDRKKDKDHRSAESKKFPSSRASSSSNTVRRPRVPGAQNAILKILVLGDPATGKTSIIKRYVHDVFSEQHKTTIGVDFALKSTNIDDTSVRLQLWDIAGQEHYRALNRVYYKDSLGAMLVYDLTRPEFDNILKWKEEIDTKVELPNGKRLPVVLCANKADLVDETAIDTDFLDKFCEENGFAAWFATSAKENANLTESASTLVRSIFDHPEVFAPVKPRTDTVRPGINAARRGEPQEREEDSWGCC